MGIDLVAGREVNESDRAPVALVNEAFLRHWGRPGGDLVGARMQLKDWKPAIVGVAADVPSRSLRDAAAPVIFVPLSQSNGLPFAWPQLTVVVRARDGLDPQALAPMVER